MVEVIPGVLEKDFDVIRDYIQKIDGLTSWIHIDLLNKTLFPNRTFTDVKEFEYLHPQSRLELHMMVAHPARWLNKVPSPPFHRVIAHIEAEDPPEDVIYQAKNRGLEVGLALDLPTPVAKIVPYLSEIDAVLVMGINTGFSGQSFSQESLEKIREIKRHDSELFIAVDGGMKPMTAKQVVEAGADGVVSTSFISNRDNPAEAIDELGQI